MGELEWRVVVNRDGQAVVGWQRELRQCTDVVHPGRADNHNAVRVTLADRRERRRKQLVPRRWRHRVARLVEQLEIQPQRPARVVRRDLRPQRQKPGALLMRSSVQFLVVVDVEHDVEVPPQSVADRPVDPPEKRRADQVGRALAGMSRPPHRQPHRAEPGSAHVIEVPLPQPELRTTPEGI
jgi:hypothetical protein